MSVYYVVVFVFFFFQAEDGIRDHCVTGVQTCALPISAVGCDRGERTAEAARRAEAAEASRQAARQEDRAARSRLQGRHRSEERRVGKECRARWSPDH